MNQHTCTAAVIHCIDFRFQEYIQTWLDRRLGKRSFDRIGMAGGIFDLSGILTQVDISYRLHQINKVILINHEDCGAYGKSGSYERHVKDLILAEKTIESKYPDVDVETYYIHLDGTFEEISRTRPESGPQSPDGIR